MREPFQILHESNGGALDHTGFQIVPVSLLAQRWRLGLSPTNVVILLQINRFWWTRDQDPFPRTTRIAEQMGLRDGSVERCLNRLEAKGVICRLQPRQVPRDRTVRPISLLPLARSLALIAGRVDDRRQSAKRSQSDKLPATSSPIESVANGAAST